MNRTTPMARDLVLLGGGHSHVIVIRRWAANPVPGVRVTLVSPDTLTPYSGMLPGLVAGHYSVEETHIDLARLCRWAGIRFVRSAASGVDAAGRRVLFDTRPAIEYDLLSVNTGGAPCLVNVPGAAQYATPVKPVHRFHARWRELAARARESEDSLDIGVVGAGAGGFEILLAMNHALNSVDGRPVTATGTLRHRLHWFVRDTVLEEYPAAVRRMALRACAQRGVYCHHEFDVVQVNADGLLSATGQEVRLDAVVWCTEAMAAAWPAESGLDCDERGFIRVSDTLQSLSHPDVFAAGDAAMQRHHPRPRAGVFAVRQGPVLAQNLRRAVLGERLRTYRPQKRFLTLLSMGDRTAIGRKGPFIAKGTWVWRWKHWIDNKFMFNFNKLPKIIEQKSQQIPSAFQAELALDGMPDGMRCGGCGAKLGGDVLASVMDELDVLERDDLPVGLASRGDVAVIDCDGTSLAQSVDQVRSFVDDPWLFGRIATIHALSDLYAARSVPQSAMVIVTLPWGAESTMRRELSQLMGGVTVELSRAGCALSGGHTAEGLETSLGFVVNGYSPGAGDTGAKGPRAGDCLILTKPLGTGVILAAAMRARAAGPVLDMALESMLLSNARAAGIIGAHGTSAMTDVTGFGLAGHLLTLLRSSGLSCHLWPDAVPALPGAAALHREGIHSSLQGANVRMLRSGGNMEALDAIPGWELLTDPQTSGGLLAVIPPEAVDGCLEALRRAGYDRAACIGTLAARAGSEPLIACGPVPQSSRCP